MRLTEMQKHFALCVCVRVCVDLFLISVGIEKCEFAFNKNDDQALIFYFLYSFQTHIYTIHTYDVTYIHTCVDKVLMSDQT